MKLLMNRLYLVLGMWLVILLSACGQATASPSPTQTLMGEITPYRSPTPSRTPAPPTAPAHTPTPFPTATPTPFTYTVVKDDTMLGIALRFGITLDELLAANPEVDRRFISVGTVLVVPLHQPTAEVAAPTATPLPLGWGDPLCYRTADVGIWCFLLVNNPTTEAIENLSARISLYAPDGSVAGSSQAISPLNLLPAGSAIPLAVFFPPPMPADLRAVADQFTASAVQPGDKRYLNVQLDLQPVEIDPTGLSARVLGSVKLAKKKSPSLIWIATVAYDAGGKVIGMRKLEMKDPCVQAEAGTPEPGVTQTPGAVESPTAVATESARCGPLPFELTVYSLDGEIARVEALVEARP